MAINLDLKRQDPDHIPMWSKHDFSYEQRMKWIKRIVERSGIADHMKTKPELMAIYLLSTSPDPIEALREWNRFWLLRSRSY